MVASRLSEDPGRSVCVVEGGPDYGPHGTGAGAAWPPDLLDGRLPSTSHDWRDDDGSLPVARVIGGCSAHNVSTIPRGAAADYDEWPGDWSAAAMEGYLGRAEEELGTRMLDEEALSPWFATLWAAASELGLPVHDRINAPEAIEGPGRVPFNLRGTVRWNAAFAYLDRARSRPNLTIVADTLVDRVLISGSRVGGAAVLGPDGEAELHARSVVLTAGAYGSPAILLRSGVGPADELARHGIEPRIELPVGRGLRDHFGVPVAFEPTDRMEELLSSHAERHRPQPCSGLFKARSSSCPAGLWDLMLVPFAVPRSGDSDDPGGHMLSSTAMLMKPEWSGDVRLRDRDPRRLPIVTEYSLASDHDLDRAMEGVELVRRLARSRSARGLVGEELKPGLGATGEEIRTRGRDGLNAFFHPTGTCAMGAVVDESGRVPGCEGLAVADASVIPAQPRAGTCLTVIALAEALSERLARR